VTFNDAPERVSTIRPSRVPRGRWLRNDSYPKPRRHARRTGGIGSRQAIDPNHRSPSPEGRGGGVRTNDAESVGGRTEKEAPGLKLTQFRAYCLVPIREAHEQA